MSVKENKALIRLYYDLWNRSDMASLFELFDPGYVLHLTDIDISLEQEKQIDTGYLIAFSDVTTTVDDMVAEGDKVAVRATWKGLHRGEWLGIAPTGKRFDITNTSIFRIAGGKIAEIWSTQDSLRFLQQLGVIPIPKQ